MVTTRSEQLPSSSHRKMEGRFTEKFRFSKKNIEFGWPFYMKHFRAWLEKLYQSCLNENDNFETKGNQSCMVAEFHMGAILTKMTNLICGN